MDKRFLAFEHASFVVSRFFRSLSFTIILLIAFFIISPAAAAPTVITTIPVTFPGSVDVNPLTNRIYVGTAFNDGSLNALAVIDGATNTVLTTIPIGLHMSSIGVNPATNRVYITNNEENSITIVDGATNTVITTVPVGLFPVEVGVNPITNRIYTANHNDNTVSVLDGSTNTVIATIPVGTEPRSARVNPTTNRIYVPNSGDNNVSVIDGATNAVIATVPVGLIPVGVGVNPTTNRIYVTNADDIILSVIDGATNTVIDTIQAGSLRVGVSVNPTTNRVYVISPLSTFVGVIDGATNTVITSVDTQQDNQPDGIAVNPVTNRIYVTGNDDVWVIEDAPEPGTVNLALTKTASPVGIRVGEQLTYTLTVANVGTAPATNVELVDSLPSGLAFVSVDQAACSHAAGQVTCAVGTLNAQTSFTVNIVVMGSALGSYPNTATVSSAEPDSDPGNNSASFSVGVGENFPPDALDDQFTTFQDTPLVISIADILSNDSDPEGDTLTLDSITQPANGTATSDGSAVTYTPNTGFSGADSFTYTVSDGHGGSDTGIVNITVTPGTPGEFTIERQITQSSDDVNEDGGLFTSRARTVWIGTGGSTDHSYLGLRFKSLNIPAGVTIEEAYLQVYTPTQSWIRIRLEFAAEAAANSQTFSSQNRPSQRALTNARVAHRSDTLWQANSWVTFEDISAVIQEVVEQPGWQSGNSLSLIIRGKGSQWGRKFVTSYNGDPTLAPKLIVRFSTTQANLPPVAVDDRASTDEDVEIIIPVLNNDSDANGQPIQIIGLTQPTNGSVFNGLHEIRYVPHANFNGRDSFTYTIADSQGETATATVNVIVAAVEDAPAAEDDEASTIEGQRVRVDVMANDSDADGDVLVLESVTQPANGSASFRNGVVRYQPNSGFVGTDTFTYTINDGKGNLDTATVTVIVHALSGTTITAQISQSSDDVNEDGSAYESNSPFTWIGNGSSTSYLGLRFTGVNIPQNAVIEDAYLEVFAPFGGWIQLHVEFAAEAAGDSLTFTSDQRPSQRPLGTARVEEHNDIPWAANDWNRTGNIGPVIQEVVNRADWQSGSSLSLIVRGIGGQWGRKYFSSFDNDPAHAPRLVVRFTEGQPIAPLVFANTAPVAVDDTAATVTGVPVVIELLANDSDPDGQALTVTAVEGEVLGALALNSDQTLTYTPAEGFSGTESFTYTISDGSGGTATAAVNVTVSTPEVTVTPVEDTSPTPEPTETPVTEVTEEPTQTPTVEPTPTEAAAEISTEEAPKPPPNLEGIQPALSEEAPVEPPEEPASESTPEAEGA